jgi:exodeoxyribonuclease VII small subunit
MDSEKISFDFENNGKMTYETAITRLSEIVRLLESGQLTLDDSLALYQEGVGLARLCEKMLNETEAKIELLIRKESDKLELIPFEVGEAG